MNSTTTPPAARKPRLSLPAIGNLSVGFFGIQVAFALQNANVSRIFQTLGASIDQLPILWIAGPVTGLLVQPLVGYFSDRTWGFLGRRRPYFLAGALAGALALTLLPNAPFLWLAVIAFWTLDVSINVSMEPFRAFVGDMLPAEQRTSGYAVQTVFIGAGALAASAAPYVLSRWAGISGVAPAGVVADSVRLAFYIGAVALFAAVLLTVLSTREYSPAQLASFASASRAPADEGTPRTESANPLVALLGDLLAMPRVMRRLALIQFFSWSGLFVLWIYSTPVVAAHQFHSSGPGTASYNEAADWVGVLFAAYNAVSALYAFVLPRLAARFGQDRIHALSLIAGALGFAAFWLLPDPRMLVLAMVGVGIAWASILTMPYTILCGAIPYRKFGTYMGLFNFFIVLPQLFVSGTAGFLVRHAFPGDPAGIMLVGAASLIIAAALSWRRVPA